MECWLKTCENHAWCRPSTFRSYNVDITASGRNLTFLNGVCPTNPPNADVVDFGIFIRAIQYGIIGSSDFPKKLQQCFGWGLRNLSSFGSNLETSANVWQTVYANLVSALGLLLFLYLIGQVQLYMQFSVENSENSKRKESSEKKLEKLEQLMMIKANELRIQNWVTSLGLSIPEEVKNMIMTFIDTFEDDIDLLFLDLQKQLNSHFPHDQEKVASKVDELREIVYKACLYRIPKKYNVHNRRDKKTARLWMLTSGIPVNLIQIINQYVELRLSLENHKGEVNLVTVLAAVHAKIQRIIKQHLSADAIKQVPILKGMDKKVYEEIMEHLKPVYEENSYIIRRGEPIPHMLFVTKGIVLVFRNKSRGTSLSKGSSYGDKDLLDWVFESPSFDELPIATMNLKSLAKVEGLVLNAVDLKRLLSRYWWKSPIREGYKPPDLSNLAAKAIQHAWRRKRRLGWYKNVDSDWSINMFDNNTFSDMDYPMYEFYGGRSHVRPPAFYYVSNFPSPSSQPRS